jgi:hypothetical protein
MKTKHCKVFLLISVIFMILTMVFGSRVAAPAAIDAHKDVPPITKQNPEKPCLKMQHRQILKKLEKLQEAVEIEYRE